MMFAIFDRNTNQLVGFVDAVSPILQTKYLYKEISPEQQNLLHWRWQGDYTTGSMVSIPLHQNSNADVTPVSLEQLKIKDPSLKLRYVNGLGDLVAWFLHIPPMSWVVRLITGKINPCKKCSARIKALNTLLTVPIWKIFFKSKEEVNAALFAEYTAINNKLTQEYANRSHLHSNPTNHQ